MSLDSHPLVKKLKEKLLPEFEKIVTKIHEEIPNIKANIESYEVGSTNLQGYSFNISCLFKKNLLAEESDNVALGIDLYDLTMSPRISACVCWGHPSGFVEAEFPDFTEGSPNNSLIVSDEILEDLYKDLPRLYEALFEALKRRKPADE